MGFMGHPPTHPVMQTPLSWGHEVCRELHMSHPKVRAPPPGLPLGTEPPVMTPSGIDFSFLWGASPGRLRRVGGQKSGMGLY